MFAAGHNLPTSIQMVSAVAEAVAAPQHVKGGIHPVQSQQSILDIVKIEEGVQDVDLSAKAPGMSLYCLMCAVLLPSFQKLAK